MTTKLVRIKALTVCVMLFAISAYAAGLLPGTTGSTAGASWQSSWLDLKRPADFKTGEKLRIKVEGTAENVLVRLLPSNSDPNSSDGREGNVRKVPANGILEVKLEHDHPNVKQISVHAGKEAWGTPLGGNNGTVRVISVERSAK
jgi:hypothetical protein